MANINASFVDDKDLELGYHDKNKPNVVYTPGYLKAHFVNRHIKGIVCVLNFFSLSASADVSISRTYQITIAPPEGGDYHFVCFDITLHSGIVKTINGDG